LRLRLGQHERCAFLPNELGAVASFIETHARAQGKNAPSRGRRAEVRA
jgi:hypothetical protein